MTTQRPPGPSYALARSAEEYERLRAQARAWESATQSALDRIVVAPGARCLDAGCGPGVTMAQLALRVGPTGLVRGLDVDEQLGVNARDWLHGLGHRQCVIDVVDLQRAEPLPGGPYDVVYARLVLLHVTDRVGLVRRLWEAVAPGGYLLVQDYDLDRVATEPELATMAEWRRVVIGALEGSGADTRVGLRLPALFGRAGVGVPDGTEVAGRLDPLRHAAGMIAGVHAGLTPRAIQLGLLDESAAAVWGRRFVAEVAEHPEGWAMWPLLCTAWRRRPTS